MGRVFRICCVWIPCGLQVTLKVLCLFDAKWLQTSYQALTSVAALHLLGFPLLACLLGLALVGGEKWLALDLHGRYFLDAKGTPQNFKKAVRILPRLQFYFIVCVISVHTVIDKLP